MSHDHPADATVDTNLEAHANNAAAPAELDKIRSILFGEHLRAFEMRVEGLEAQLTSGMDSVRKELSKHVADLRQALGNQHSDMLAALANEREAGSERIDEVRSQIHDDRLAASAGLGDLQNLLADREQALTRKLDESSAALHDEIASTANGLAERVTAAVNELQANKTDREALARMFAVLSNELGGSSDRQE